MLAERGFEHHPGAAAAVLSELLSLLAGTPIERAGTRLDNLSRDSFHAEHIAQYAAGGWIVVHRQNPHFSRAVWDMYLGRNNVSDSIKKGLVSRL